MRIRAEAEQPPRHSLLKRFAYLYPLRASACHSKGEHIAAPAAELAFTVKSDHTGLTERYVQRAIQRHPLYVGESHGGEHASCHGRQNPLSGVAQHGVHAEVTVSRTTPTQPATEEKPMLAGWQRVAITRRSFPVSQIAFAPIPQVRGYHRIDQGDICKASVYGYLYALIPYAAVFGGDPVWPPQRQPYRRPSCTDCP